MPKLAGPCFSLSFFIKRYSSLYKLFSLDVSLEWYKNVCFGLFFFLSNNGVKCFKVISKSYTCKRDIAKKEKKYKCNKNG